MRGNRNAEAQIQAAIVAWIRMCAPRVLVFAVPNGGLRSKPEAARMKWTGTLAGVHDLCVLVPGGRVYFLEVKTAAGRMEPAQIDFARRLLTLGCRWAVVRSIDEARDAFRRWGIATIEARSDAA